MMKPKLLALVVCLLLAAMAYGQNPAGRQVGPDGKPLAKAADPAPAPTPDPAPVPVVAVQSWTQFLTAFIAALAALGALIQGLRNGSKAAAIHDAVKSLPTAAWRGSITVPSPQPPPAPPVVK